MHLFPFNVGQKPAETRVKVFCCLASVFCVCFVDVIS